MMKKIITPVLLAMVGLVLALVLLPAPTMAQPAQQVSVANTSVTGTLALYPLDTKVFTVAGFAENDVVDLTINGVRLDRLTIGATGGATSSAKIPAMLPAGSYSVRAENQYGEYATYTASISPVLKTKGASFSPGAPMAVYARGMAANVVYTITWETATTGTTGTTLGTGTTSKYGTVWHNVTVPEDASPGTYYVRGTSLGTEWVTATPE